MNLDKEKTISGRGRNRHYPFPNKDGEKDMISLSEKKKKNASPINKGICQYEKKDRGCS